MSTTSQETLDEWVLACVRERTEPDPESAQTTSSEGCTLWTSVQRMLQDGDTPKGVGKSDIKRAALRLNDEREILIGRVNQYLAEIGDEGGGSA